MNWLVLTFGTLLVLALGALSIGPYFVDWTRYTDRLEANAERVLGTNVSVGGEADLRILPRPRVRLGAVTIGPPERPLLTAEHVELDIELTPLAKGELQIAELSLDGVTLSATLSQSGALTVPPLVAEPMLASFVDAEHISVQAVRVSDGRILVTDERDGARHVVEDVQFTGSARSLAGPFTASGRASFAGRSASLSLAGGLAEDGAMPLSVRAVPDGSDLSLALEGTLATQLEGPALAGTLTLEGAGPTPWSVRGDVVLDAEALRLGRATLSYGEGDTPLQLTGQARYDFAGRDPLEVALSAQQIDLDRLGQAFHGNEAQPPSPAALARDLVRRWRQLPSVEGFPVAVRAELDIATVLLGGAVVRDVSARGRVDGGRLVVERAEAFLPGETELVAEGRVQSAAGQRDEPLASGSLDVRATQPAVLARWWAGGAGAVTPVEPLAVEADVELTAAGLSVPRLTARVGRTELAGRTSLAFGRGGPLAVALHGTTVDMADLAPFAGAMPWGALTEADGRDVVLDLSADEVRVGSVEGSAIHFDASFRDGTLTIDALTVDDLAGAQLFASGALADVMGEPVGSVEGTFALNDGPMFARALRSALPRSAVASRIARAAPALTPGNLAFAITGERNAEGGDLSASVSGSANGTAIELKASGAPFDATWAQERLAIELRLITEDAPTLVRQAMLPGADAVGKGDASLTLDARGVAREGLATQVRLEGPGLAFAFDGSLTYDGAADLDGTLAADAQSLATVGALANVPLPPVTMDLRAEIESVGRSLRFEALTGTLADTPVTGSGEVSGNGLVGTLSARSVDLIALSELVLGTDVWATPEAGGWPNRAFVREAAVPLPVRLAVETERLQLGPRAVEDAAFTLAIGTDGTLRLAGLDGEVGGGRAEGSLALRRAAGEALFTTRVRLEGVNAGVVGWHRGEQPAAEGVVDLELDLESRGYTVAGLMTGLSGEGALTLRDAGLRSLPDGPLALPDGIAARPPEEDALRRTIEARLDETALQVDRLSAPLAIENGVLSLGDFDARPSPPFDVENVVLDLGSWSVRADLALPVRLPNAESVRIGLTLDGPIDAPRRGLDVSGLVATLSMLALERQVEAVERDNEALAAEADASGAPPSEALERLNPVPPTGAEPDTVPADGAALGDGSNANSGAVVPDGGGAEPSASSAGDGTPDTLDSAAGAAASFEGRGLADHNRAGPTGRVPPGGDAVRAEAVLPQAQGVQADIGTPAADGRAPSAPAVGEAEALPFEPLAARDPTADAAPLDQADEIDEADDPLGNLVRRNFRDQVEILDEAVSDYEARLGEQRRMSEELRRTLGFSPESTRDADPTGEPSTPATPDPFRLRPSDVEPSASPAEPR